VIRQSRRNVNVSADVSALAAQCINLAVDLIQLATTSININSSAILQASFFHTVGYLWNAIVTLILYVTNDSTHRVLKGRTADRQNAVTQIQKALLFFKTHQDCFPFLRLASQTAERLMKTSLSDTAAGPTQLFLRDVDVSRKYDLNPSEQVFEFFLPDSEGPSLNHESQMAQNSDRDFTFPEQALGFWSDLRQFELDFWNFSSQSTATNDSTWDSLGTLDDSCGPWTT
jgi:hypothetical protein